jgi:hypothetical protein
MLFLRPTQGATNVSHLLDEGDSGLSPSSSLPYRSRPPQTAMTASIARSYRNSTSTRWPPIKHCGHPNPAFSQLDWQRRSLAISPPPRSAVIAASCGPPRGRRCSGARESTSWLFRYSIVSDNSVSGCKMVFWSGFTALVRSLQAVLLCTVTLRSRTLMQTRLSRVLPSISLPRHHCWSCELPFS